MRRELMTALDDVDILSFDAQAALAERYQRTRDARTAAKLVAANRRLLMAIVRRVARGGFSSGRLLVAGEAALRQAITQFEPASGVPFPGYATRVIRARFDAMVGGDLDAA